MNRGKNKSFGLIHIYCGEGKGKTTAAIGLMIRAAGHGKRCLLVQFLKDGQSGEIDILRALPEVRIITGQKYTKFSFYMNELEKKETLALHMQYLEQAVEAARSLSIDLLVLDEAFGAIQTQLLSEKALLDFLQTKPGQIEVVMTGRYPSEPMLAAADYISEIACCRHPYQRGIPAREGIEY